MSAPRTPMGLFERAEELAAEDSAECECGAVLDLSDAPDAWAVIEAARAHGAECPLMEGADG